jgi:hypothetical protein
LQVEGGEVRDDFSDNVGREHERNLLRGWGIECSGTIWRLSSAVKVPLDAITDRLRESEDADYCAAVIERLKAVIAEFEPPAKTAKPPKRRKAKVAAAEPASEQRVEAESKSSKHVMTFKIPL